MKQILFLAYGLVFNLMEKLAGQIAVITGASSGIGKAIALCLAEQGLTLCLIGRDLTSLELVATRARKFSPRIHTYQADLTKDEDLKSVVEGIQDDVPCINILVHCAGVLTADRIETADVTDFDSQYYSNVRAPYALTKGLLSMITSCAGQVVMMNSSIWQQARAGLSQYAATKYALKGFTDSLRDEVNGDGVRVLSMFLGRTATPMQADLHEQQGTSYHPEVLIQPEDVALTLLSLLTLPDTSEVTDIHIRPMKKTPS